MILHSNNEHLNKIFLKIRALSDHNLGLNMVVKDGSLSMASLCSNKIYFIQIEFQFYNCNMQILQFT